MRSFGARAAAEELARLLDAGTSNGSVPGVALAGRLRSTGLALDAAVAPRAEFREALRMRLVAVATVQASAPAAGWAAPAAPTAPARALEAAVSWRRRGSAVAAGVMASVVAVSGVAVAGSQSLPGDPFYGVKRTAEALQLSAADGDVEKGTRHLDFAATRLREVRGLTLGRDAVDAGPALGPSALSSGLRLRSAERPLAAGAALGVPLADRVTSTLAEMDEQTRAGSELLTSAYRSSRAPEPLRALSRFATRQSVGIEQLLPALPPASRSRARASLALVTDVRSTTDELLGIGTCGSACDPTQAAPTLPAEPGAPPAPETTADCACPQPAPAPEPRSSDQPTPEPTRSPGTTEPRPTTSPSPSPAPSPSPSPSPSGLPLPPLPVPLPTLPLPLPTITLTPQPLLDPALSSPTDALGTSSAPVKDAPAPAPTPAPLPQLTPVAPRP